MKTRVRLLAMFVSGAILFAGTLLCLKRAERQKSDRSITLSESIVGTWLVSEHDPPLGSATIMRLQFLSDGRCIITIDGNVAGHIINITKRDGKYSAAGEIIRVESLHDDYYHSWSATVSFISIDEAVLINKIDAPYRVRLHRCAE